MKPFMTPRRPGVVSSLLLTSILPLSQLVFRMVRGDSLSGTDVSLPLCASLLVLLLIPVPYNRRYHLRFLEPAILSVGLLPLFGCPAEATVMALLLLSLAARHVLSRRKTSSLHASLQSFRYRDSVCDRYSDSLLIVWAGVLALSLCGPVPAILSSALGVILGIGLIYRICCGNPLATLPSFDVKLKTAVRNAEESALSPENMESERVLYDRCCRYMNEKKPYLVESFSIGDLANAVYTNKSYLSRTINRLAGKNFRSFLNEYRISYSKELFMRNMSLKVNDLAELSGFHTITTYTMAFKSIMDESPSTWCRKMRIESLK